MFSRCFLNIRMIEWASPILLYIFHSPQVRAPYAVSLHPDDKKSIPDSFLTCQTRAPPQAHDTTTLEAYNEILKSWVSNNGTRFTTGVNRWSLILSGDAQWRSSCIGIVNIELNLSGAERVVRYSKMFPAKRRHVWGIREYTRCLTLSVDEMREMSNILPV